MSDGVDDLDRNLAAQKTQLDEVTDRLARLRAAAEGDSEELVADLEPIVVPRPDNYAAITEANLRYLQSVGRIDVQLEDLLEAEDLALLRLDSQRLNWSRSDIITVGICGVLGAIASILEGAIDGAILEATGMMGKTELIASWERETSRLPIDFSGEHSGGGAHRTTSAGHDIARPVEAIRQIVEGRYQGTTWMEGDKRSLVRLVNHRGNEYAPVQDVGLAAALWVKHLVTDVVTTTSLPLPGWTKLFEIAPTEQLADFFRDMYFTKSEGPGWNLRTMSVTKMVPIVVVEVGVRAKSHWGALSARGEFGLTEQERTKLDEMLLGANGVVAFVSTGRAVIECLTTQSPLGLRALNPGVLVRTGHLGVNVYRAHRERNQALPASWEELARTSVEDFSDRLGPYAI